MKQGRCGIKQTQTCIGKCEGMGNDRSRSPRPELECVEIIASFVGAKDSGELFNVDGVRGEDEPAEEIGLEGSSSGHEI